MEVDKREIDPEITATQFVDHLVKLRTQLRTGIKPENVMAAIAASIQKKTFITDPYKDKIIEDIGRAAKQGVIELMGYNFFLDEYGINLVQKKFGICDPNEAKGVERKAIYMNLNNRPLLPNLQREHDTMMQNWIRVYESKYNETINR